MLSDGHLTHVHSILRGNFVNLQTSLWNRVLDCWQRNDEWTFLILTMSKFHVLMTWKSFPPSWRRAQGQTIRSFICFTVRSTSDSIRRVSDDVLAQFLSNMMTALFHYCSALQEKLDTRSAVRVKNIPFQGAFLSSLLCTRTAYDICASVHTRPTW